MRLAEGLMFCGAVGLIACTASTTDDGALTTGSPGASGSAADGDDGGPVDSSAGDSAGTTGAPSDDDGDSSPVIFDVGAMPDVGPPSEHGCHKVDFLFVIDNSGSMGSHQTNLVQNFPNFIAGIQQSLEEVDSYHVGVVTTDAYEPNVAGCDQLGGLVVSTGGDNSSNAVCGPYAEGGNFMTSADDLPAIFPCVAQVGTSGSSNERTMDALVGAVDGNLANPGQCNDGFLRSDALLVIVIITDESGDSAGSLLQWFHTVVEAKGGFHENVAVVSLVNYAGGLCPPSSPTFDGQRFVDFANLFGTNAFVGGICEDDYGPLFQQAIAVIEGACDGFIPG